MEWLSDGGEVGGGREGEICFERGVVSRGRLREEGGKKDVQMVRTMTRKDPEIKHPMTFRLILAFLIPGKHSRRPFFFAFLGFCQARRRLED